MPATILYVEDNAESQQLIATSLSSEYTILLADNSADGYHKAIEARPDLILLDTCLPDANGYALCEQIREAEETRHIPVVFVSGMTSLEDRLCGYRAGGDDYVCKPLVIDELKSKITVLLNRKREQGELQDQLANASSTAMLAMTTNGETGAVLNFTIDTYHCRDYQALATCTFEFLAQFGLKGCLQLRGYQESINSCSNTSPSPLEDQLLEQGAQAKHIVTVRNKTLFNEDHSTLLIKNMPVEDSELNGRMRDNLALAMKGIDARMKTLRLEESNRLTRNEKLEHVIYQLRDHMRDLDEHFGDLFKRIQSISEEIMMEAECRLMTLGLSSQQEQELLETLKDGSQKLQDLQDHSQDVENRFLGLEAAIIEATLL